MVEKMADREKEKYSVANLWKETETNDQQYLHDCFLAINELFQSLLDVKRQRIDESSKICNALSNGN